MPNDNVVRHLRGRTLSLCMILITLLLIASDYVIFYCAVTHNTECSSFPQTILGIKSHWIVGQSVSISCLASIALARRS